MTDYTLYMIQLNSAIIEIEGNLTTDITNEMTENNYVKFYFDGFVFTFENNSGEKFAPSDQLQMILDEYYGTIERDKLEINL